MKPNSTNMPQPGDQSSRDTRSDERPLTDNERRTGPEQDQDAQETQETMMQRSNMAGDQDVEDMDDDDDDEIDADDMDDDEKEVD